MYRLGQVGVGGPEQLLGDHRGIGPGQLGVERGQRVGTVDVVGAQQRHPVYAGGAYLPGEGRRTVLGVGTELEDVPALADRAGHPARRSQRHGGQLRVVEGLGHPGHTGAARAHDDTGDGPVGDEGIDVGH